MIIDSYVIHSGSALGDLTFVASPDHATVLSYTARARLTGTSPIVASLGLGKPNPDPTGVITYNIRSWLNTLAAGNYDVTVAATDAIGTTDSTVSNAFTVPVP